MLSEIGDGAESWTKRPQAIRDENGAVFGDKRRTPTTRTVTRGWFEAAWATFRGQRPAADSAAAPMPDARPPRNSTPPPRSDRGSRRAALALTFALALGAAAPALAQQVRITSTPNNGTHYVAGEAITTRLDLPAHLHSGNPAASQMKLDIGARQRRAASTTPYSFALAGVNYSYTVVADDVDTDGIGIPANAIVVSGQPWRTAGSAFINLNNAALSSQAAHKVIGSTAYISATNPSPLTEASLNGATVTVALDGLTYASGVTDSDFLLATTVQNLSIASVGSVSSGDTTATLTLAFTGDTGFELDGTLTASIIASAHSGTSVLTTGSVPVLATDTAPSFGSGSVTDKSYRPGMAITEFQVPAATGGNGALTYIASNLPTGLVFDADGTGACPGTEPREICGTPTTASGAHPVTITVTDEDTNTAASDAATLTFQIAVTGATLASTPTPLTEANLNGARLTVGLLGGATFTGVSAASFELVTVPAIPGLSIGGVTGGASGSSSATLTLATGAGYGFSTQATIAVRALAAAHSGTSDLVSDALAVSPTPGVTVSKSRLALNEAPGTNNANRGAYTVALATVPTGCTGGVGVAVASDNADVTVSPSTLTFTTANWSAPQTVTVTAAQDDADSDDDVATLSHSIATACAGAGYPATLAIGSVTVTVADDEVGVAIVPTPATLTEANLNGATLALSLTNTTFAAGAPAAGVGAFELVSAIPNLTVSQVSGVAVGGTTATLTLAFTGDFRGQPTLAVRVPAASHQGAGVLTSNAVAVTAAPGVTVSETGLSLSEEPGTTNANRGTYTIVPDSPPAGCAGGVGIAVASDNADVTANPAALTFTASNWNTARTVTVTAAQDDDGADDAATLSHSIATACVGAGYPASFAIGSLSVAVDDDETPAVVVDADPSTANVADAGPLVLTEGHATDAAKTYSVRLATPPTQTVTVTLTSADADAVSIDDTDGDDSNGVQDTLTFTSTTWGTAQTVTARAADDADAMDESVALTHTASTATASEYYDTTDGVGVSASLTATVADDDALAAPGNVMVSAQVLALRVQWDAVTGADGYKVQWKSGSEGYDAAAREAAATGTSHTLPNLAAGTEYTLRVLPTRTGANDGPASAEATGTPLAVPTLAIDSPGVTEGDSGTQTLTFTVTLSHASQHQVTVDYADAGSGTATSGTDYTAIAAGTLTFAAAATTQTFDVAVTGDVLDEADETIAVTLSTPVNATLSATATGTGTVTDNDDAPTVSIDSPSVAEGTGATGGTLTFTVSLSAVSGRPVTVAWARTGGTATAGAAGAPGTDYTAIAAGALTFAAGTTTRTIDVSVTGDAADEADETVVVTLSAPMHAALATAAGTGTITDDDDAPTVSIDSPSVTEGTGAAGETLRFTVSLSAASGRPVTVAYADAGTGTATSGTDYTALTAGTLTFTAGTTTRTIDVSVTGDATDEANETVAVTLSTPVNATLAAAATGTGTVTDDDDAPTVSIDAPHVVEGAAGTTATLRFTVALSAASGRPVTVAYADAGTGTATSGTDYTALAAGTLTFTAGTTTRTIDVTVTGDAADEQNETVAVTLSTPVNATLAAGAATGTGTVVDDDGAPTLTLDAPSVAEGTGATGGTLTFTVTLSPASAQQVTVSYRDAGTGTATSGTDYTALAAGTLTFTAGTTTRTIDVTVTGDAADEADETVAIALSAPVNAALGLAAGTGTITDDDDAPTVSIDSPSVTEGTGATGGTLTFTVTLSAASGRPVTVAHARTGGTAASGTDYTAVPAGTLTFAAGETAKTLEIAVAGDAADEADETIAVTLSAPVNASIATGAGTGTITDDDAAPTVSIDSPRVAEGAPGTAAALRFTVSLSAASGRQVRVAYADAGAGTATSGEDYAALAAGTLIFAPGTTARAIDVSVTGDAADEADEETIAVTLSAPVNASIAAGAATGRGPWWTTTGRRR